MIGASRGISLACIGLALLVVAATTLATPRPLTAAEAATLSQGLANVVTTPEQYVLRKFERADVVLLAEDHALQHNLKLAQRLIPLLYRAGIYNFGMEFGASEDQAALDTLVTGAKYDESVARRLMFNYNVGWVFKEYMDIYRVAWELNRSLPAGARKFRILNLSYRYDFAAFTGARTPAAMAKVYYKGPADAHRAEVVQREILARGEKLLVLTGTVHAFTRYAMPMPDYNGEGFVRLDDRHLGNRLLKLAPGKVVTILLHQPFPGKFGGQVRPANGALDQVFTGLKGRRVGFDLVGTPMGELADDSYYATGYSDFRLRDLADGYIYEMPIENFRGCEIDEAFLTDQNWPQAQRELPDFPGINPKPATRQQYLDKIREYVDTRQRYRDLN
ncbi:hypothetical protein [Steroidobacter sp.]|uniref:hypothetical protein n=1 Tax=Steroidobacter sp. TaxID=1978227 RepID=UPI001A4425E7|nr:hypothetical protein [Steroidobacter sp.]MBL8268341.1 hypothetical protein [Steroidobacter sp.]